MKHKLLLTMLLALVAVCAPYAVAAQGAGSTPYSIYLFQEVTKTEGDQSVTLYEQTDVLPMATKDAGAHYYLGGVSLPANTLMVISRTTPNLYADHNNLPSPRTVAALPGNVYEDQLFRITAAVDYGTLVYTAATEVLSYSAPLYFDLTASTGNYHASIAYNVDEYIEMDTYDGVNYFIENLEIPQNQLIGLTTNTTDRLKVTAVNVFTDQDLPTAEGATITNNDFKTAKAYKATKHFKGNVNASLNGTKYKVEFTAADFPSMIYLVELDGTNTKDFIAFEHNDGDEWAFQIPAVMYTDKTELAVSRRKPVVGKKLFGYKQSDPLLSVNKSNTTTTYTIAKGTVSDRAPYVLIDGRFYGSVLLKEVDATSSVVLKFQELEIPGEGFDYNDWANEDSPFYEGQLGLQDGTPALKSTTKKIFHDNASRTDATVTINGQTYELEYMDGRRALTGRGAHINRLASGSLASVINVQTGLENLIGDILDKPANFVGIADVKLASAPMLSVRDVNRYYAAGTEAGFNIVAASGTNVLSLSVIEMLSLGFYRDGELITVVPAAVNEGTGVGLGLVTINGSESSYDIKAVAPCLFDEIAIYTASGLKLNVGGDLKINYAFVGKEKEITLGTNGIARYNQQHPGHNLRVAERSTTYDAAGVLASNFVGDEDQAENIVNTLNILELGMGWAKVCMDDDGEAADDNEQLFKKGSRINFVLSGGSVLKLGVGTGSTVTFYTRNVTGHGTGRSVSFTEQSSHVLTATVLQLNVVEINGNQVISMVAPIDFSGAKLTINDGLVNLGLKNIYYASVTPAPYQPHFCELNMPTTVFLTQSTTHDIYYDADGNEVRHEISNSKQTAFTPGWDTTIAPDLTWTLESCPEGANPYLDRSTGRISNIDREGVYKIHYQVNGEGHEDCQGTINVVAKYEYTYADDAEITSLIGHGVVATDKDYELSGNTHGIVTGGIHIGQSGSVNSSAVLDNSLYTSATLPLSLTVGQNELLVGVKKKSGHVGGNGKNVRVGFIVEHNISGLDLTALNFFQVRCYDNALNGNANAPVNGNQVIEKSEGVGLDLIGADKIQKTRFSVVVPGDKAFDEFQLWVSGVADVNLSSLKIYGAFIDEDVDAPDFNPWLVDDGEILHTTAHVIPVSVGTVQAGSTMANISDFVDNDIDLTTRLDLGEGADVGRGFTLRVFMGRTVHASEKVGIITGKLEGLADVEAGKWMTVRTLRSPKVLPNVTLDEYEFNEIPVTDTPAPAPRKAALYPASELVETGDEFSNWVVAAADVAGAGDKSAVFFSPTQDFDVMEMELGNIANVLSSKRLYGITLSADASSQEIVNIYREVAEEVTPNIDAYQLLQVTDTGKKALAARGVDVAEGNMLITYSETPGSKFYTVDQIDTYNGEETEIDAATALDIIKNPENVIWTSNYLLITDDTSFRTFFAAKDAKTSGVDMYVGDNSALYKAQRRSSGKYVTLFSGKGKLAPKNFNVKAKAWYTLDGSDQLYAPKVNTIADVTRTPVTPKPYGIDFLYRSERNEDIFPTGTVWSTTSSVLDEDGHLMTPTRDYVYGDVPDFSDKNPMAKNVLLDGLTNHTLYCDFDFYRPNVDDEILFNNRIYYELALQNNLKADDPMYLEPTHNWYRDEAETYNKLPYVVSVGEVNALAAVWPRFTVRRTIFAALDENFTSNAELDALYAANDPERINIASHEPYKNGTVPYYKNHVMSLDAPNNPERLPLTIDKMNFSVQYNDKNRTYDWYYTGVAQYTENGDDIHNDGRPELTLLNPSYYDVESYIQQPETSFVYATSATQSTWNNYYDLGRIFEALPQVQLGEVVGGNGSGVPSNTGNAGLIASFKTQDKPTIVITPIYVYRRNATPVPVYEANSTNELVKVNAAPAAAPKRIGENTPGEEHADMDIDYIVKRGAAGIYKVKDGDFTPVTTTGVENLTGEVTVTVGRGTITIAGTDNATVFNALGIAVARGEGTHSLPAGIYVVTTPGSAETYMVQ